MLNLVSRQNYNPKHKDMINFEIDMFEIIKKLKSTKIIKKLKFTKIIDRLQTKLKTECLLLRQVCLETITAQKYSI